MYISRLLEGEIDARLSNKKVLILLGARQVGKTTLIKNHIACERNTFLNLDIEVDKQKLLVASKLPPAEALKFLDSPDYLVIDEAQRLPETGRIVKGWYDTELPVKIILLGSSSLNILNQSAESLTGRNEKLSLTPLTYEEALAPQGWYSESVPREILLDDYREQIAATLEASMIYGGYPEAVLIAGKKEYLTNLVGDYLLKDIMQLALVKTPDMVKKLLYLLAMQIGSLVSVSELARSLAISRETVERYLELLEETYVIFRLPAYSTNPRKEISKSQKIFFWDTGVRNALIGDFAPVSSRADIGGLWENWVVAEFAKYNALNGGLRKLYFWRSRGGGEIDIVIKEDEKISAFEVKWRKGKRSKADFSSDYRVVPVIINSADPFIGKFFKVGTNNVE
ncbi:MAG: ATPase [Candidatus Vogelbacteria bacterium CG10_big_fil_rev_8_21_14_0_10_45_14]|uniref:ATPase n=1 Tax=Candidatus Vogelbacteria bacterium CG10_big_fil_rev_8_21_14_0_10_45_14 TaxID=1975042 RepID=A0A2H0RLN5_9BACT|nr:MAG: ATPase [Candidatus Vogelbacteria bacterium CG10_big_fil_rev_8_21_14_0_10_45_14]